LATKQPIRQLIQLNVPDLYESKSKQRWHVVKLRKIQSLIHINWIKTYTVKLPPNTCKLIRNHRPPIKLFN